MPHTLNHPQRQAVSYTEGPLLVLAGAGSGKTRVITHKIAHLINEHRLEPDTIIAVTFTNKAAREMKARVQKLVGAEIAKGLQISTFHTLGMQILRRHASRLNYRKAFSIHGSNDTLNLLKELMRRTYSDPDNQVEQVRWQIGRWKQNALTPEDVEQTGELGTHEQHALNVYHDYQQALKTFNAFDLDDLILQPIVLLREHTDIRQQWQIQTNYLLVDEYQDTNQCQYELVKLLSGERARFTVVGDDDQSIYTWRGAQPQNLAQLSKDFPNLQVVKLEQNFRSTRRILRAANQLIANNSHVFDKKLWSNLPEGDPIKVLRCRNEEHEAQQVVAALLDHKFTRRTRFGDYAILYRGNHQARLFERSLREYNIPYTISGGLSFFDYSEVKDIMAYLRLIANPSDDNAFVRIANTPRREIGATTLRKLSELATQHDCPLYEACDPALLTQSFNARAAARLGEFKQWIERLHIASDSESPARIAERVITEIDYEDWLHTQFRDEAEVDRKMDNVREILNWFQRLRKTDNDDTDLAAVIAKLTLIDNLDKENDNTSDQDRVSLMTLHAAKGLEFPYVFLVGMEENLLPHRVSIETENIDEERRLAYVGITRAQQALSLSFAAQRKRYGEVIDCEPSRFVDELPGSDLQWTGDDQPQDAEQRQSRGQAHLANLRDLLGEA
jgi:ATP-dependent DNA helicase Rep